MRSPVGYIRGPTNLTGLGGTGHCGRELWIRKPEPRGLLIFKCRETKGVPVPHAPSFSFLDQSHSSNKIFEILFDALPQAEGITSNT